MSGYLAVKLSDREFERISNFVYEQCGINLSKPKKVLVESRLQKRLSALNIVSFSAYCDMVMSTAGDKNELVHLIDAISTNKTDFFREPVHFDFLENEVIPRFMMRRDDRTFKVWSSACSSGEEPYTTAMVLEECALRHAGLRYSITASDISTRVLERAVKGIYDERIASVIPMNLRKRYLLRSKNQENPTVRIDPALRAKIQFKRVNLTEDVLEVEPDFDVIFCRNVLIYFDRKTQEQVIRKLVSKLRVGGHLFIGHSESIYHMDMSLQQVKPTVFRRI
jgi:chemotaxis protein methyltransferase CheR